VEAELSPVPETPLDDSFVLDDPSPLNDSPPTRSSPAPNPSSPAATSPSVTPLPTRRSTRRPDHRSAWNPATISTLPTPPSTQPPPQRNKSPARSSLPSTRLPPLRLAYVAVPPPRKRPLPDETPSGGFSEDDGPNVWALDSRHPAFLHNGEAFLRSVPGDDDWDGLLSKYIEFEGLAPPVSA